MAKTKGGITRLSGKLGDDVFIDSNRYTPHVRKPGKPGSKKNEPALKKQYKRTGFLNRIASELNKVIRDHSDNFKSARFYEQLHKRFRREPADNRFLLLQQLTGMEINPDYPLTKLGAADISVNLSGGKIVIELQIKSHPSPGKYHCNCYYYEVLLLCWNKTEAPATYNRQFSDWIYMTDKKPAFEFLFPKRPGTTHWLVCLRARLGIKAKAIDNFKTQGMQIAMIGSFDKKEQALLNSSRNNNNPKVKVLAQRDEDIPRVKAKTL